MENQKGCKMCGAGMKAMGNSWYCEGCDWWVSGSSNEPVEVADELREHEDRCIICARQLILHNAEYYCHICEEKELGAAGYWKDADERFERATECIICNEKIGIEGGSMYCKECVVRGKGKVDVSIMKGREVYWIIITGAEGEIVSIDVDEERAFRVAFVLKKKIIIGK